MVVRLPQGASPRSSSRAGQPRPLRRRRDGHHASPRKARDAGIAGLEFLRGIPGTVGGFVRMNGGAYGREVSGHPGRGDARAARRASVETWPLERLGYTYRHSELPEGAIVVEAPVRGRARRARRDRRRDGPDRRRARGLQPLRSRTGGSTFKNPPGTKAWQLIDAAGCRGLTIGDAQVSEKHCNFLLNLGEASAADIEALGEEVRRRVHERQRRRRWNGKSSAWGWRQ